MWRARFSQTREVSFSPQDLARGTGALPRRDRAGAADALGAEAPGNAALPAGASRGGSGARAAPRPHFGIGAHRSSKAPRWGCAWSAPKAPISASWPRTSARRSAAARTLAGCGARPRGASASSRRPPWRRSPSLPSASAGCCRLPALLEGLPRAELGAAEEARLRQGQTLKISGLQPGLCAVVRPDGAVIGLGSADGEGTLRPLRLTSGLTQTAEKHLKSAPHIERE